MKHLANYKSEVMAPIKVEMTVATTKILSRRWFPSHPTEKCPRKGGYNAHQTIASYCSRKDDVRDQQSYNTTL